MVAKSNSVVTVLRAEIIDGTIPAGTRLKEEAIATRFGVSRVPIREALLQLESEGFVNTEKYKGATVSARSQHDVVELMQIRRGLEVLAATLAAEAHGGDQAEHLRAVVARGRQAGEDGAVDQLPPLIMEFHEVVARASGNAELARMLEELLRRISWGFELEIEDRIDTSWADHAAIATAILGGSPVQAGYLMGEHILKDEWIYRRQAAPSA
ncbi:GntR family transcriptional regulator [Amycolatopsis sp. RTGN1]|uniref:GntR family transcriptional regulator n=1 Tax=Amycolatopsis ponsaeliensis TaxID=2992142 RepID=UPI00254CB8FD|nr:GntR family transcriptional regulator [Amycolatopsis sp. RTGN1]